jgi:hypothetical protein
MLLVPQEPWALCRPAVPSLCLGFPAQTPLSVVTEKPYTNSFLSFRYDCVLKNLFIKSKYLSRAFVPHSLQSDPDMSFFFSSLASPHSLFHLMRLFSTA